MKSQNLPYIEDGFTVEAALIIASFMAWQNATADAVKSGALSVEAGIKLVRQSSHDIEVLMLGQKIAEGTGTEAWLGKESQLFLMAMDALANNFESLSAKLSEEINASE